MNPPLPAEDDNPSPHIPPGPKKDYALKEDETFTISIPGRGGKSDISSNSLGSMGPLSTGPKKSFSMAEGTFPLLPPPPSAPKRR